MVKTLIFALLATMCATFLWGCGGKVSYTTVDGTMLGTTLHVVADVQGTSPQELYAAVMALDREAKASMSIFDPASLLSRLNRNQTDSVDRQGNPWRIGIETPFDGNMSNGEYLQRRIGMTEGGLATSGNYRRFYLDAKGNKIAHTIDPRTGRSAVSRLLSVTVAAPTCAEADALGTMFLAMGADDALAAAKSMPRMKVYFILADGADGYEEYVSPAMKAAIMQ